LFSNWSRAGKVGYSKGNGYGKKTKGEKGEKNRGFRKGSSLRLKGSSQGDSLLGRSWSILFAEGRGYETDEGASLGEKKTAGASGRDGKVSLVMSQTV